LELASRPQCQRPEAERQLDALTEIIWRVVYLSGN
jgi:hypothetical protein